MASVKRNVAHKKAASAMNLHLKAQDKLSPDSWARAMLPVGFLALCPLCALLLASLPEAPASDRDSPDSDVSHYALGPGAWFTQFDKTEGHLPHKAGADPGKGGGAKSRPGGEHTKAITHLGGKIFKAFLWIILPGEILLVPHNPAKPSNQLPQNIERASKSSSVAPQLLQRPPPGWDCCSKPG